MPKLEIVKPNLEKNEAAGGQETGNEKLIEEKEGLEEKIAIREKGGPGTILEERRTEELLKETERKLEEAKKLEDEIKSETEQATKKPSFEEYKAQQEKKIDDVLKAAREKKDAAYEDEKETAA